MGNQTIAQTIRERRTVRTLSDQPLSIDTIYQLLETASYAPFHSKNEPWQVCIVSSKQERNVFVEKIMASYDRLNIWSTYDPQYVLKAKKRTHEYFLNVPVSLIITAPICEDEIENLEAISAVSAFIQNFQLAAWTENIGVTWRTIPVISDKIFKEAVGVTKQEQIIGLLDITGIDQCVKLPMPKRAPVETWTQQLSDRLSEME
ncbi:hypothetical protein HW555_014470 [Spodoptera exigua]|uniref:Nitroreductase domain-containing protein n=1 Tax=Spodoptera exigua TaxID=7107 RepID=A0A835FZM0_SPOEX|nr:hypothetical protein HW555_014470 [Spodoptera exigua]